MGVGVVGGGGGGGVLVCGGGGGGVWGGVGWGGGGGGGGGGLGYYMGVLCVMRATLSKFHVSWGFGQSGLKCWGVQ